MFWPGERGKDPPMDIDVPDEYMEIEAGRPSVAAAISYDDVGEAMDIEEAKTSTGITRTGCGSSLIPGVKIPPHSSKADRLKIQSQSDLLSERKDGRMALRLAEGLKSPWSDPSIYQIQIDDLEKTRKQLEKISTDCGKKGT
ncbi:uncharacterized protein LOC106673841 [Cimex lectularius]|uniref:Uncharacterized protein n=1 Tax=Cimex lectularius TaxID=79782 RepID=A0A8I6SCA9_CIMLE|nr:uncharacterized protein LOC106673841 [Cimex lectularius]XP_014261655.1 uncharacterized protein LOC106673841 [Cimex lectularius]